MRPRSRGTAAPGCPFPCRSCRASSCFQLRHVEPLLLPPALQAELGELHAFRTLEQIPAESTFAGDVLQKELPLRLESVVVVVVRHLAPPGKKIDRLRNVRIPHRLRRLAVGLC